MNRNKTTMAVAILALLAGAPLVHAADAVPEAVASKANPKNTHTSARERCIRKFDSVDMNFSLMLTVAPGWTAPVGSLTLPRIRPKFACANIAREKSNTTRVVISTHPVILGFTVTDVIALSISNAPLTIGGGSTCIILQVVKNLPTPNLTSRATVGLAAITTNNRRKMRQAIPPRFHLDISSGGAGI